MESEDNTLRARLERLEQLRDFGEEFQIRLSEDELSDGRARVLSEFYEGDLLAREVSLRGTSYTQLIEPIEERYGSFLKRVRFQRKGESIDEEVVKVVGSINNVGAAPIDIHKFTRDGIRRRVRFVNGLTLVMGGLAALIMGASVYRMEIPQDMNVYLETFMKSSPGIGFAMPYLMFRPTSSLDIKRDLRSLRKSAEETDEFLRKNYI